VEVTSWINAGFDSRSGGLKCCVELLAQHLARRQYRKIFGDMYASSAEFQQLDLLGVLTGAKNNA
jgi:hypothetical protein